MPPSTPEEISRQHGLAEDLVYREKMPCSPRQELGEIVLEDKIQPTWIVNPASSSTPCTDGDDDEKKEHDNGSGGANNDVPQGTIVELKNPVCFSTRGQVNVSKLQDMIREATIAFTSSNNRRK